MQILKCEKQRVSEIRVAEGLLRGKKILTNLAPKFLYLPQSRMDPGCLWSRGTHNLGATWLAVTGSILKGPVNEVGY